MLDAEVKAMSDKAREIGVRVGMKGKEALTLLNR